MKKTFLLIPLLGFALSLLQIIGCKKNEPTPEVPMKPKYAGTYVGIEKVSTLTGGIGNPGTTNTYNNRTIVVLEWNDKIIMEGDTLQLDSSGHYEDKSAAPKYFEVKIKEDSLWVNHSDPPVWKFFSGKRK